jgi:hypothetical protein
MQRLERASDKPGTILAEGDGLIAGLALDPFVTVAHDVDTVGSMAMPLNGETAPCVIDEMERSLRGSTPAGSESLLASRSPNPVTGGGHRLLVRRCRLMRGLVASRQVS